MLVEKLGDIETSFQVRIGEVKGLEIDSISHFSEPKPRTFVFAKKSKILKELENLEFSDVAIVIQEDLWSKLDESEVQKIENKYSWCATVQNVDYAISKLSKPFYDAKFSDLNYMVDGRQMGTTEIDPDAEIAQNVFIGEHCKIGAYVKIMPGCVILPHVEIGDHTIVYPNVNIYPFTKIGSHCRIHSGTVIGTDGFGYNFFDGAHQKVWHIGGVEIGNDVEIGCNTMIDAGTFSPTRIGDSTRVDNDVQLSHNVQVGRHNIICGKTGLAGSVTTEDYCAFGAGAGVAPSAYLEQGSQVAARAVVSENARVPKGSVMAGHPARPLKEWLKTQATLRGLAKK
ncbi:MAG: UDP-3-O-(3-hydroxymyristoyl)glucosamine N-acyltransferase [Bdellovibrionota bacterium]|nr:UDP-3-O-(3-hydroxymyristoyl)glucosamine N-acyltransferase [Bdellovibrionota bacterium]